jgi:DNA-binding response OmpR family regulator
VDEKPTEVLLVEDSAGDARLLQEMLADVSFHKHLITLVGRLDSALRCLEETHFDLIVLDLGLPDEQGFDTFARVRQRAPQIPIIVLTGLEDEPLGLKTVRGGAQDYLIKGRCDGNLLARAMRYAIERKRMEEERERLILELSDALAKVKTLSGLLPICASCKRIRDDAGYWTQVEVYIKDHADVEFSHGICPECFKRLYPDFCREEA